MRALGAWIIHRSPDPPIDVHLFHRYAIAALRSGVDPYAITFPDIYHDSASTTGLACRSTDDCSSGFPISR